MSEGTEVVKGNLKTLLERYRECAEYLVQQCRELGSITGAAKLERKCAAELKYLRSLNRRKGGYDVTHLRSSNLGHYAGVVHATKDLPRVTHILQAFSCPGRTEPLHMDVVAAQGNLWVKVVARKAQALHLVWAGEGQYGEKDIIQQAKDFITCSKVHPVNFEDPRIVFAFYNGVTEPIAKRLERLGVIIVGTVVPVDCDVERSLAQMAIDLSDSDNEETMYDESGIHCPPEATCLKQLDPTHHDIHESEQLDQTSSAVNTGTVQDTKTDLVTMTCLSKEDYHSEEQDSFNSENVHILQQHSALLESSQCSKMSPKHSFIENKCKDHPINSTVTLNLTNSVVETLNNIDSKSPEISQQNHVPNERLSNILALQGSNQGKTNTDNMSKIELISEKQISELDFGNNRAKNVDCYSTCDNISTSPVLSFVAEELLITPAVDYTALRNLISANKINVIEKIGIVNLDITALITLVSAVSHGGCYYKFQEKVLSEQAAEERKEPVLPGLTAFLEGKEMFACETAVSNFRSILETLGGTNERRRADQLLSQVTVVTDQPSFRASSLPSSGKLKERSKIIFGTGDALKAVTVTANSGFVRAAEHQGVTFAVFLHASRALTEQKETTAEILSKEA